MNRDTTTIPTVSVIVIVFNQELDKIIKTLDSIVIQEGIPFEIIVCDDGSEKQYEDELRRYFESKSFYDYTLVFHPLNEGTVANYYSGLETARGKYSKLISPGDCLSEKHTLRDWIEYLKSSNAEWSFSDAYYYRSDNGSVSYFQTKARPQIIRPYLENDRLSCTWNYVALRDIAIGAAMIGNTQTQMRYCKIIKDKGIKYCEDHIYFLMMFHGIVGCYFPKAAICYEYGTGISTSGNLEWREKLAEDRKKTEQIMLDEDNITDRQKRMIKAFIQDKKTSKIKKLFIKGKLSHWMKWHFHPRLTPIPEKQQDD